MQPAGPETGCTSVGIQLFEGGFTHVFNNVVMRTGLVSSGGGACYVQTLLDLSATQDIELAPVHFYNNVAHECKGAGIAATRRENGNSQIAPQIYNNTVVAPIGGVGINVHSSAESCVVRDNIVAGSSISADHCLGSSKNQTGDPNIQKFADVAKDNFELTESSPAIDAGTSACPATDLFGRTRNGECDRGALEFAGQTVTPSSRPLPPQLVDL
jgi:hypothetical protein